MEGWIICNKLLNLTDKKLYSYSIEQLLKVAKKRHIKLTVYDPTEIDIVITKKNEQSVLIDGQHTSLPDFVLPMSGSNTSYYALSILRHLTSLGVFVLNSARSIECVGDKLHSQQVLAEHDLPIPKTVIARNPINIHLVSEQLGFPVIVKTASSYKGRSGSGMANNMKGFGVFLSENKKAFEDLMGFLESTKAEANIILQEYVESSRGRDLRVFVLGDKILGCCERRSTDPDNFKSNIAQGGNSHPAKLTPEIEWLALQSSQALGLNLRSLLQMIQPSIEDLLY